MTDKEAELTGKEQLFVDHYVSNGFNATRAYIDSEYKEFTNKNSVRGEACKVRNRPHVSQAIEQAKREMYKHIDIDKEFIAQQLQSIATDPKSSSAARVSALSKLSEFTGGFDKNVQQVNQETHHTGSIINVNGIPKSTDT